MEANELAEDFYDAKPVCWGFTETKNGVPQYTIEFSVTAYSEAGPEAVSVLHRQGFSSDKSVEILTEQLRACGWKRTDFGAVDLDTDTVVRVKIVQDEYGAKIKGIYAKNGASVVQRYGLDEDKKKAAVAELNERLRQMGLAAPASSPVSVAHRAPAAAPAAAPARAPAPAAAPAQRPQTAPQRQAAPAARPATQARPAQRPAQQPAPQAAPPEGWFGGDAEQQGTDTPF